MDRGKPGSKRHVTVDRQGTPLSVVLSAANVNDSKVLEQAIDAIPPVYNGRSGAPRFRPDKLHADKAYDNNALRELIKAGAEAVIPSKSSRTVQIPQIAGLTGYSNALATVRPRGEWGVRPLLDE